jgi:hypothetical protein
MSTVMPVSVALDLCDRVLGEIGRRMHRFSWLRPPGSSIEDCLVVDAYYPGNRLVVICPEDDVQPDPMFAERVPQHGLRLLVVELSELGLERRAAEDVLVQRITALGPRPARPTGPVVLTPAAVEAPPAHALPTPPQKPDPPTPPVIEMAPNAARAALARAHVAAMRSGRARDSILRSEEQGPEADDAQRFGVMLGVTLVIVLAIAVVARALLGQLAGV